MVSKTHRTNWNGKREGLLPDYYRHSIVIKDLFWRRLVISLGIREGETVPLGHIHLGICL